MAATARKARLAEVALPEFGMPDATPELPPALHADRLERLRERASGRGYEQLLIYADREHCANLAWLSGFDPRFEEALLVVGPAGDPLVLVGNEDWGMAGSAPLRLRRELFQDFSLPSQPRDRSRGLRDVLGDEGIGPGRRLGLVGWKTYAEPWMSDVPAYIVDTVRGLVEPGGSVENATDLFIDAGDGLRVVNEVEQLAVMEAAACRTSQGVRRLLFGLLPALTAGPLTEREAVQLLQWDGTPLSCHLMLTAGPRATLGLLSPGDRPIQRGDRFTTAFGIWGALNCRAGFVVANESGLPEAIRDYVDRLVGPYFEAVAEWYGALRIGQTGGALFEIIQRRLGDPFFGIFLNPGHQIGLDEWVNSPVWRGSEIELRSGMAMQVDMIPATGTEYFTTNIEDGIALADDALRGDLAGRYPAAWRRIEARRSFMSDALGVELHPDVLPFSNIPAYLPPFLLRPERAMSLAA